MTDARQALGKRGEDLACEALAARGYAVVARRFRTRFGELDIVAEHAGVVVFVEVKARQDGHCGDPAEAVTPRKQQRVVAMALDYLRRFSLDQAPCRFDVVSVVTGEGPPEVEVLEDAFRPGWS